MSSLELGLVLNQRYTLTATLGAATGRSLFRAVEGRSGETVLVEVFSGLTLTPTALAQLQRTLETLRQIRHPNLLGPLEAFEFAGQLILVMENAPGDTLRGLLQQGPLKPERARHMALDVCDALSRAHREGLTHGALSPDCIYLDETSAPQLAGFGLAALVPSDPRYTPPEAWQNQPRDVQTDLWLLGATLYEILAGKAAFTGNTPAAVQRQVLAADYAPLPPATPPGLAAIVRHLLAAQPSARYATLRQVAVDLELGAPTSSGALSTATPPPTAPVQRHGQPATLRAKPAPSRWPGWVLTGLALICVLVAGGNILAVAARATEHAQLVALQARLAAATALPSVTITRPAPTLTPLPPTVAPTATRVPPTATPAALASPAIQPSATPVPSATAPPSPTLPPAATQDAAHWLSSPVTWTSPADGMVLVYVPAGEFTYNYFKLTPPTAAEIKAGVSNYQWVMNPFQSQVYLNGFWMDWTQVTNAQYARFQAARPDYQPLNCNSNTPLFRGVRPNPSSADNYPVVNVNWYDAAAYCAWAGRRMPTEVERVKAAGLGDSRFANGDDFCVGGNPMENGTSCQMPSGQAYSYQDYLLNPPDGYAYTAPVRNYPNLNRSGNVAEWVADWFYPTYSPGNRNPLGPDIGYEHQRAILGQGWDGGSDDQRGYRMAHEPSYQSPSLGFRCAVSAAP